MTRSMESTIKIWFAIFHLLGLLALVCPCVLKRESFFVFASYLFVVRLLEDSVCVSSSLLFLGSSVISKVNVPISYYAQHANPTVITYVDIFSSPYPGIRR